MVSGLVIEHAWVGDLDCRDSSPLLEFEISRRAVVIFE
jgi:hypothetical protein